jgi:hypothetical protein
LSAFSFSLATYSETLKENHFVANKLPSFLSWKYDGNRIEWQPPQVDGDATTEDLANLYKDFQAWLASHQKPEHRPIPDDQVRCLLRRAFFASLHTDEHRPVRGTLFVEFSRCAGVHRVLEFADPEELTDKRIATFCPALEADDALDDRRSDYIPAASTKDWLTRHHGLLVRIEGPGIITLRLGHWNYTLERNRIIGHVSASWIPLVMSWLTKIHKSLGHGVPVDEHPLPWWVDSEHEDLDLVLSRMLEAAARLRHGGTIVVLSGSEAPQIRLNYRTNNPQSLKALVEQFRDALNKIDEPKAPNALRARHRMLTQAAAVGRLTATDGCVVLDRSFQLLGFGGIIDPNLTPTANSLTFQPPSTDPTLTEEELLRRFGTRHRSSYLLCKTRPNTLAFVLSQDGGWKVFASDDQHVHFFDHVSP